MSRGRFGAACMAFAIIASACGAPTPQAPDIAGSFEQVVGVAFFDANQNGSIDAGEQPAEQAEVTLGQGTAAFQLAVPTDANGGFVVDVPGLGPSGAVDIFAQVSFLVPGPSDEMISVHFRQAVHSVEESSEPVVIALPQVSPCSLSLEEVLAEVGACGEALLPDLVPLVADFGQTPTNPVAASSVQIDATTEPGHVLLRFASATANLGEGTLHMIPDANPAGFSLGTWQRVWTSTLSYIDRRTGEFVYHEGHEHFHLEAFEQYRLLDLDGAEVAVGDKISFCLVDSLEASSDAKRLGFGVFVETACQGADVQQALNPGWTDYYGAGLDDQWIDITGVPAGDYLVEIVVDPEDLLVESDESNNRATFPVTITAEALAS